MALAIFASLAVACSSGGTSTSSSSGATEEDSGTVVGADSGAQQEKDAAVPGTDGGADALSPADPKIAFTATLGGQPATVTKVEVARESPTEVKILASLSQESIPGGATGTPSITLYVSTAATGTGMCGSSEDGNVGVSVAYSKDGSGYFLGPQYAGGSCQMNITRQANGTFTAGSVSGTAGGQKTIAFNIVWAQKTPP